MRRVWQVARTDPGRILRADRETVAATLRREAGLVTRRGRTAVFGALSGLADLGETADAAYARVLGGHTLNLALTPPVAAVGAAVVLVRRGVRERVPAVLRDGTAEGVALLGARPGGVALDPGRWRILLALTSADGRETEYPVRHREARHLVTRDGGPTADDPPCPDTGYRYAVERSPSGALLLTVTPPEPAAELTVLRTYATGLWLTGRFVGVGDPERATLVFAGPGRREVRVPADVRGPVFEAEVPVGALAGAPGEFAWKVWAEAPGAGRLRVGRFLTGLRSPNAVYRRPNRMVRVGERAYAMVRTTYTTEGGLTLVCAAGRTEP